MLNWDGIFYNGDQEDLRRLLRIDSCFKDIYARRVCRYRDWAKEFVKELTPIEPGARAVRVFNDSGACMGLARAIGLADTHLRNQARKQEAGTATGISWGPAITFEKVCNLIAMNMLAGEPVGDKKGNCDGKGKWCDE